MCTRLRGGLHPGSFLICEVEFTEIRERIVDMVFIPVAPPLSRTWHHYFAMVEAPLFVSGYGHGDTRTSVIEFPIVPFHTPFGATLRKLFIIVLFARLVSATLSSLAGPW